VKIAIVRLTSLGDIIFCMAALQLIKRRLPESSITWFADRKFADILDYNPDLAGIVKIDLKGLKKDFSTRKLWDEYRRISLAGKFDLVIDLHGMVKSAFVARMIGRKTVGFHRSMIKEPLAALFYQRTLVAPGDAMPAYRYAQLAMAALGFSCEEEELKTKQPFLFYRDEDGAMTRDLFRPGVKNVIFVPGTSAAEKNYPWEKYVAIAEGLRQNVLVCHGSDQEYAVACAIAESSSSVSLLPRLNLNQLKAAISRADLVIGGDTGPTHIAWANNVPSITLFGPTPPCTYVTKVNRIITAPVAQGVLSIRNIEVNTILTLAEELLQ
jgi:heptosyltransferase-1